MKENRGAKLFLAIVVVVGLGLSMVAGSAPVIADDYRGHRQTSADYGVDTGEAIASVFLRNHGGKHGRGHVQKYHRKPKYGHRRNRLHGSRHSHFGGWHFGGRYFGNRHFKNHGRYGSKFSRYRHGKINRKFVLRGFGNHHPQHFGRF